MSQYHLISSGAIIAKAHSDYNLTPNGWEGDAVEWIAEALNLMRVAPAFTLTSCKAHVKDFRCKIPCALEYFGAVEYNGSILATHNPTGLYNKIANGILGKCNINNTDSYQLNPNFIHTTFESGEIIIHYYGYCLDECGYPMVPDDEYVRQALSWYILYKYLMRGNTHPVFDFTNAEARWIKYKSQAENSVKRMTPTKYDTFTNNWVSLIPYMRRNHDYYANFNSLFTRTNNTSNVIFTEPTIQNNNQ